MKNLLLVFVFFISNVLFYDNANADCLSFAGKIGITNADTYCLPTPIVPPAEDINIYALDSAQYNLAEEYKTWALISNASKTILYVLPTGVLTTSENTLPKGETLTAWLLNFEPFDAGYPSVNQNMGTLIANDAIDDCYALSPPFNFVIAQPLSVQLNQTCLIKTAEPLSFVPMVEVEISGGTPALQSGGTYTLNNNLALLGQPFNHTLTTATGSTTKAFLGYANGNPFAPGDTITLALDNNAGAGYFAPIQFVAANCLPQPLNCYQIDNTCQTWQTNIIQSTYLNQLNLQLCKVEHNYSDLIGDLNWQTNGLINFTPYAKLKGLVTLTQQVCLGKQFIGRNQELLQVNYQPNTNFYAEFQIICPPLGTDKDANKRYDIDVVLFNGQPPYTISGDFNATNFMSTNFETTLYQNEPFSVKIVDSKGKVITLY
jgi:hypothetical protein